MPCTSSQLLSVGDVKRQSYAGTDLDVVQGEIEELVLEATHDGGGKAL